MGLFVMKNRSGTSRKTPWAKSSPARSPSVNPATTAKPAPTTRSAQDPPTPTNSRSILRLNTNISTRTKVPLHRAPERARTPTQKRSVRVTTKTPTNTTEMMTANRTRNQTRMQAMKMGAATKKTMREADQTTMTAKMMATKKKKMKMRMIRMMRTTTRSASTMKPPRN